MRTVNIDASETQLGAHLQDVRNGEELIIRDRNMPIAYILPFAQRAVPAKEEHLVASGAMKLPQEEMDLELVFRDAAGNVSHDTAVQAVIDTRGDR